MGWLGSPPRWLRKQEEKQQEKFCPPVAKPSWMEVVERVDQARRQEEERRALVEESMKMRPRPGTITRSEADSITSGIRSDIHVEMDVATMERRISARDRETGEWVELVPKTQQDERGALPPAALPINWLEKAALRAEQSDIYIRLEIEASGVTVFGQSGEDYVTKTTSWEELDTARINPLFALIEQVEHHMATLGRVKEKVGHG